jgi:hypothetical protein
VNDFAVAKLEERRDFAGLRFSVAPPWRRSPVVCERSRGGISDIGGSAEVRKCGSAAPPGDGFQGDARSGGSEAATRAASTRATVATEKRSVVFEAPPTFSPPLSEDIEGLSSSEEEEDVEEERWRLRAALAELEEVGGRRMSTAVFEAQTGI